MIIATALINALLSTTTTTTASARPLQRANTLTAASILQIDSTTATCSHAPAADECRTAAQAAPYIALSFTNFAIASFAEQAALLADMLYESSSFKYAVNHYPGTPGQGTRIMMSPAYVAEYAEYLSTACADCGISAAAVADADAQGPAEVLGLVNTDEWGFGAGAWFLATQCGEDVRQSLATGTQEGWEEFLTGCLAVEGAVEERSEVWREVMALDGW